ncbi:MAG: polysaccharide export protein [Gammaproteobacteria bacterium]|nr:polysaccharide export protein [Gammaproteobacteria bacterium]
MFRIYNFITSNRLLLILTLVMYLTGCSSSGGIKTVEPAATEGALTAQPYLIGPGDRLNVFVWGNTDLSTEVTVRPDGRISTPLVEDVMASGKTPVQLAREMEKQLAQFIKNPVVTVMVQEFVGALSQQIRVVGEAAQARSIPYRENLTLLDVMIAVGGLTEFASGNKATIVRTANNNEKLQIRVRLEDLVKYGDITANVDMKPGDILIIPEAWF